MDEDDIEAAVALANTKRVDWQLAFATKYFDACVPNPLGYSSSVAAVTILPSASELANAWGKWYAAAGQLRRLRFIRSVIQKKVGYEINDDPDEDSEGELDDDDFPKARVDFGEKNSADHSDSSGIKASLRRRREIDREIFRDCTENQEYYRTVLGFDHGSGMGLYDFGPEQTAMYSREFAQGASSCCPNGCFEGRVRRATIDELREMEKEALERVHAANLLLEKAQIRAVEVQQGVLGSSNNWRSSSVSHSQTLDVEEAKIEEDRPMRVFNQPKGHLHDDFNLFGSITGYLRKERGMSSFDLSSHHWKTFEKILHERPHNGLRSSKEGATRMERLYQAFRGQRPEVMEGIHDELHKFGVDVKEKVAAHLARESTYAVITFMSRQAAVAARQCLADGRGQNRWITAKALPVPPLADAAPFNLFFCRGCCRPVSLSIHQRQKSFRKYM